MVTAAYIVHTNGCNLSLRPISLPLGVCMFGTFHPASAHIS